MIIDTVFSPSFGNRPSLLVGRDAEIADITNGLACPPGSRDRCCVILGQRGGGKTVLLWEIADRAADMGYVVASPTVVSSGMLERIVEKVQDSGTGMISRVPAKVSGGSLGAFGFSVGLQFQREIQETKSAQYRLTQLARALTEKGFGMLILVDELQPDSEDVRKLAIAYQELVGEGLNVALIMAGLPQAVSSTLNDHVLTFLNRAGHMELEPLRVSDVDAYYESAFRGLGLNVDAAMRGEFARATEGSPYLMQLIGHNVVVRAGDSGCIGREQAKCVIDDARRDFQRDVCQTVLCALSEKDREFLAAMAKDEGPSSMADIAARMGKAPDYAQKYRRRLIDSGTIEVASRGFVGFAVPYLRDYLAAKDDK